MRLINSRSSFTKNLFESLNENNIFNNASKKNLKDVVERDFQVYLEDKYDIKSFEELDNLKVTEDDVNDYFTGLFYDIFDEDDLDTANEAEKIIRNKYNLLDTFNEEASVNNLKESFYVKIWIEAAEDYQDYQECKTRDEAEKVVADLKKNGEKAIIETFSEDSRDSDLTDEVEWYNNTFNESAKPKKEKKPEERIIMQQGNVTCLKKDNKFKVFEDTDTNLAEYDNQEEAMRDALNRCGVNPDNELSEEKDNLKEQVDEALRTLLKKKEDLRSDDSITDDEYYNQIEMIDNIIVNNYDVKEIEEAEKELGINSDEE